MYRTDKEKELRRGKKWFWFELILLIGLYLSAGFSDEVGWGWGIPVSLFLWILINIPIGISDAMNDPFDP